MHHLDPLDTASLEVTLSELLVATADGHDAELDRQISTVLSMLRRQLHMDVVFVSEFVNGQRVFRFIEGGEPVGLQVGDAAPLEQTYCQRVVEGRMPERVPDVAALPPGTLPEVGVRIGAHLSTPVVLPDGRVYGTVCCFSAGANPGLAEGALACLRQCARLVARKVAWERETPTFAATVPAKLSD